jgi:hypothetical protein
MYSEGMDHGHKTPRGHPDFNSYVKILRVFICNGQIDRQTDGDINPGELSSLRSSRLIRCGLGNLIGSSSYTRCAWAGGTFLRSLRKGVVHANVGQKLLICYPFKSFLQ